LDSKEEIAAHFIKTWIYLGEIEDCRLYLVSVTMIGGGLVIGARHGKIQKGGCAAAGSRTAGAE